MKTVEFEIQSEGPADFSIPATSTIKGDDGNGSSGKGTRQELRRNRAKQ